MIPRFSILLIWLLAVTNTASLAQDKGTVDAKPLPPLANPNDPKLPARELFGRALTAAKLPPHPVGFYAKGCVAGAEPNHPADQGSRRPWVPGPSGGP